MHGDKAARNFVLAPAHQLQVLNMNSGSHYWRCAFVRSGSDHLVRCQHRFAAWSATFAAGCPGGFDGHADSACVISSLMAWLRAAALMARTCRPAAIYSGASRFCCATYLSCSILSPCVIFPRAVSKYILQCRSIRRMATGLVGAVAGGRGKCSSATAKIVGARPESVKLAGNLPAAPLQNAAWTKSAP